MASFGQASRGRPALYKPTDFGRDQNRTQPISSKENKTEEKVVKKIQKRPSGPSEEKPSKDEQHPPPVIILKPAPDSAVENKQKTKETLTPTGVSEKDLEKIQRLQEFMAKQELATAAASEEKDKEIKENDKQNKESNKNKPGAKERNDSNKGTNKSFQSRNKSSNNQKSVNLDKEQGAKSKSDHDSNKGKGKPLQKSDKRENVAVSTNNRAKSMSQKGDNQRALSNRGSYSYYAPSNFHPGGPGYPGDFALMQMQYAAMNMGRQDNQSILGNPYKQQRAESFKPPPQDNRKQAPSQKPAPPKPPAQPQKATPATKPPPPKPAGIPDKSEQRKSLAFVKNFFDTDPEVLYNRKHNAEKQSEAKVALAVSPTQEKKHSLIQKPSGVISKPVNPINEPSPPVISNASMMLRNNMAASSLLPHLTNTEAFLQSQNQAFPPSVSSASGGYHQANFPNSSLQQMGNQAYLQSLAQASIHHSNHSSMHVGTQSSYMPNATLQQRGHHMTTASMPNHSSSNAFPPNMSHQSALQQQQQQHSTNYPDMFSQMNPSSLVSPSSNPYGVLQQNNAMNSNQMNNYSMYSTYFPQGSQQSHVHHVEEQLNPSALNRILSSQDSLKWKETALNKCGPNNSKQARSLIEELIDGSYECMVCCDSVKLTNAIWSCSSCYHIFHLNCIRKWAKSEAASVKDQSGWRCPGCQYVSTRPPNKYFCFCGKVRDPEWNPNDGITPHSCGEVCRKKRTNPPCQHTCNELCHPGPCPSCPAMVSKSCPCGRTVTKTRCGQSNQIVCDNICMKILKCGKHHCQKKCHPGPCDDCTVTYHQECYCGKKQEVLNCGTGERVIVTEEEGQEFVKTFSCQNVCGRLLACEIHMCEEICHDGPCQECPLLPKNVKSCPCGKVDIEELLVEGEKRDSCSDPIPTCDSFCGKKLFCGPKGSSHLCMMKCHNGTCNPCSKTTSVMCRCGGSKKDIACKDFNPDEPVLCERKCNKKRKCGRHKCNQKCCVDKDHNCNIVCGKKLSCGMHKCDEVCHIGFCPPCWRAGFDELACWCGATVLYPPISCGAKPPECNQPCNRVHACNHPPNHTCHSDATCPPCTMLVNKQCMGGHEMRKSVMCHLSEVSCGKICGKPLKCGFHTCIKTCHKGPCLPDGVNCKQPCPIKRQDCAHPCAMQCHAGSMCPVATCKQQVLLHCRCGRKSANSLCMAGNVNSAYHSFNAEMLSNQLHQLHSGQTIDISKLTSGERRPKFLDCDEECARIERNKRLAEALGMENPEGGAFHPVMYSQSLKQDAKSNLGFIKSLEEVFENVILRAKKSSQSQIQHSFQPMNSTQRKIIHELAEAYNCKTYSLDQEPKRSTVLVASKSSLIPQVKLSSITEREIMQPLPPRPVLLTQDDNAMLLGGAIPRKPILKPSYANTIPKMNYFDGDLLD